VRRAEPWFGRGCCRCGRCCCGCGRCGRYRRCDGLVHRSADRREGGCDRLVHCLFRRSSGCGGRSNMSCGGGFGLSSGAALSLFERCKARAQVLELALEAMRARPRQDRHQHHEAEGDQREHDRQEDEQRLHARRSVAPDPPAYTGRRAASPPRVARPRRHAHPGLPRRQPASRLRPRDDRLRCCARRHLGKRRRHRDGDVRPRGVALVPRHRRRRLEDQPILGAAHARGRSPAARRRAARRHRHP